MQQILQTHDGTLLSGLMLFGPIRALIRQCVTWSRLWRCTRESFKVSYSSFTSIYSFNIRFHCFYRVTCSHSLWTDSEQVRLSLTLLCFWCLLRSVLTLCFCEVVSHLFLSGRWHDEPQAADPGAGGPARQSAARHEEERVRGREVERLRGQSSTRRNHRGRCTEVKSSAHLSPWSCTALRGCVGFTAQLTESEGKQAIKAGILDLILCKTKRVSALMSTM